MNKILVKIIVISLILLMTACYTHVHMVGTGGQNRYTETASQWYILWGGVPINDVDTRSMAHGAEDYTIKTEQTFLDVVIGWFTGVITVSRRTVTVTR